MFTYGILSLLALAPKVFSAHLGTVVPNQLVAKIFEYDPSQLDLSYTVNYVNATNLDHDPQDHINSVYKALYQGTLDEYAYLINYHSSALPENYSSEWIFETDNDTCEQLAKLTGQDESRCNANQRTVLQERKAWTDSPKCSWENLASIDDCCKLAYEDVYVGDSVTNWYYVRGNCHYMAGLGQKITDPGDIKQLAENMCNWCQHDGGVSAWGRPDGSHSGACMSNQDYCMAQ